jgi:hypothetical protein
MHHQACTIVRFVPIYKYICVIANAQVELCIAHDA